MSTVGPIASGRPPAPKTAFRYKPQFGVIVICRDERDQARVYRDLKRGPRKVKVVCT